MKRSPASQHLFFDSGSRKVPFVAEPADLTRYRVMTSGAGSADNDGAHTGKDGARRGIMLAAPAAPSPQRGGSVLAAPALEAALSDLILVRFIQVFATIKKSIPDT